MFDELIELFRKQLENQFLTGGLTVVVFTALLAVMRNVPAQIWRLLVRRFVTTVDITDHDPAFFWVQKWLSQQEYTKKSRLLTASTRQLPVNRNVIVEHKPSEDSKKKRVLTEIVFSPAPGWHLFFYKKSPILLTRNRRESDSVSGDLAYHESITFQAFSRSLIMDLIFEARELAFPPEDNQISIYRNRWDTWRVVQRKMPRPLDSVILDGNTAESLKKDLAWFFSSQDWYTEHSVPYQRGYLLSGPPGNGKCLGKGTPILMFDGTVKPVEEVTTGDLLMGPDSSPKTVLGTTKGHSPLFKVVPTKGDSYVVNDVHILSLKMSVGAGWHKKDETVNISIPDYLKKSNTFKSKAKGWRTGVNFSPKEVLLDPYFMGLWLGDGTSTKPEITTADSEVLTYLTEFSARLGLSVTPRNQDNGKTPSYYLSSGHPKGQERDGRNPVLNALRDYGVLGNKHIPHSYLVNDRKQRLALLAGMMDSDGSLNNGGYDWISVSERLADDLCFLARSLGFAAYKTSAVKHCCNPGYEKEVPCWRVGISGDLSEVPVLLKRKMCDPRQQVKDVLRTGISVEPYGEGEYFGFELDGDGLFLLGDFTVTHNTSLVVAMAGEFQRDVYMLSLAGLHDSALSSALSSLEEHSLIVIEDVDSIFVQRDPANNQETVSFSGFINALDGMTAPAGRVLFMTTNHPEKLDAALKRPGRMDCTIELKNASADQALRMFQRFYAGHPDLEVLAPVFADRVKTSSREYSMADLQEHIIKNRDNALAAISDLPV